jgi:hypothetical protein
LGSMFGSEAVAKQPQQPDLRVIVGGHKWCFP